MAGIPNDRLSAHGMPAQNASRWDHTYVQALSGLSWGCFGRDSGGVLLVSGAGNSVVAECLSYRRWPPAPAKGTYAVYAGIIYGVTGVCHQATNRIMYASGLKLPPTVNGYGLSCALFDEYGLRNWVEFPGCMLNNANAGDGGVNLSLTLTSQPHQRSTKSMTGHSLGDTFTERQAFDDMRAFVSNHLGETLPEAEILRLQNIKRHFREQQNYLQNLLLENEITREKYLSEFFGIVETYMQANKSVLGEVNFTRIFGGIGYNPTEIIDKDLFLSEGH